MSNAEETTSASQPRLEAGSSVNKNVFVKLLTLLLSFASVSSLKVYHLYNVANNSLLTGQESTMYLDSFKKGTSGNFAYGVFLKSRDSNGITCKLNFSTLAWGDTTTFGAATKTKIVDNALCNSGSLHGNYFSSSDKITFLVQGANVEVRTYTPVDDGSFTDGTLNYTSSALNSNPSICLMIPIRENDGSQSRHLVLYRATQYLKVIHHIGTAIRVSQSKVRGVATTTASDQGKTVNYLGAACTTTDASKADFCMFWGQRDVDLSQNKGTFHFRKASTLSSGTTNNNDYYADGADVYASNLLPYSCVLRDEIENSKKVAYCVFYNFQDNNYYSAKIDAANLMTQSAGSPPSGDTPNESANFITTYYDPATPAALGAPYRLVKVVADGSQVIMIKDDASPVTSYVICIMDQGLSFCDPSSSSTSTVVKLQKSTPGIVNPALFKFSTVKFDGQDIIRVFYESSSNEQISMATVYECDHASDFYFNPTKIDTNPCDGTTSVAGYRLNSETYAYEACAVANCDVCNTNVADCQVCKSGFKYVTKGGVPRCAPCDNPRCAQCDWEGTNTCTSCVTNFGNTTGVANDATACSGCDVDHWNGDLPTDITANLCTHKMCSDNCQLDGCATAHQCDTCKNKWMHGPDSRYCSECDANADGYGYVYDTETEDCVPVCLSPRVASCTTPGEGSDPSSSGTYNCKPNHTGNDCNTCDPGYVWKSGNSAAEGPADDLDECVLSCDPAVVFGCNECDTTDHCSDTGCKTGWIMTNPGSGVCDQCDEANNFFYFNGNCQKCTIPYCQKCSADGTTCEQCLPGYKGDYCGICANNFTRVSGSSNCMPDCRAMHIGADPSVDNCATYDEACRCATCKADFTDPVNNCVTCLDGYTDDGYGTCVPTCIVAGCSSCSAPNICETCSDSAKTGAFCDTCKSGYIWIQNNCAYDCSLVNTAKCNGGVLGCTATANVCASCKTGYTGNLCDTCDTTYVSNPNSAPGDPLDCVPRCDDNDNQDCNDCGATPYSLCNTCTNSPSYVPNTGTVPYGCHLDCSSVTGANCPTGCTTTANVCDTCADGWQGPLCDTCDSSYIRAGDTPADGCRPRCDSNCEANGCSVLDTCDAGQCKANYHLVPSGPGSTTGTCAPDCSTHCPGGCSTPNVCDGACDSGWTGTNCDSCDSDFEHPVSLLGVTNADSCQVQCPPTCRANGNGCLLANTGVCTGCNFGFRSSDDCATCNDGYYCFAHIADDSSPCIQCKADCPAHCSVDCATPSVCPAGYCATGWGPDGDCNVCLPGYHHPDGDTSRCVPDCDIVHCQDGCVLPNVCTKCFGLIVGDLCTGCPAGYENWPDCRPICVKHCKNDQCSLPYRCDECDEGYAGLSCSACDRGYQRYTDGSCIACNIPSCEKCSQPNVCESCYFGYFLTQDKSRCLPAKDVCKPNIAGCHACKNNSVCSQCDVGLYLNANATQCQGKSAFCSVEHCNSCDKEDHCEFCADGYQPTKDGAECVYDCKISHCAACNEDDTCAECDLGFYRNEDNTACLESEDVLPEPKQQVFTRDDGNAVVEFSNKVKNLPYKTFIIQFVNKLTQEVKECTPSDCEVNINPVQDRDFALSFDFNTKFEMTKADAIVRYKLNDVKLSSTTDKRLLQAASNSSAYKEFVIKNIVLKGDNKADTMARDAFITINAIRVFATVILGVCNTAHAFWSTHLFSWLQLWAVLRGPFLTYPDRFLSWHYKWYLLAINFGDPFKQWDDWSDGSFVCKASEEYPLSNLGCSITETFGQNLIVIVCVLSFCFVATVLLYLASKIFKSETGKLWIGRLRAGLAFTYFLRFMTAIMPSLIYFSILQFYTHKDTPHMALGVVLSFIFLIWYSLVTLLTYLLSKRVWEAIQKNNPEDISMESVAKRYGGLLNGLAFQFNDLKNITGFWQLQYPVLEYFRVLLISVFMIVLGEDPGVSLGFVFTIEILHFIFQCALFAKKTSIYYAIADAWSGLWFVLYLILKMASTDSSMTEADRQDKLGMAMAVFICFEWGIVLLDIAYDTVVGIKNLFSSTSDAQEKARKYEEGPNDLQYGPGKKTAMEVQAYPGSANRPN
jgi:hypothetical protein